MQRGGAGRARRRGERVCESGRQAGRERGIRGGAKAPLVKVWFNKSAFFRLLLKKTGENFNKDNFLSCLKTYVWNKY